MNCTCGMLYNLPGCTITAWMLEVIFLCCFLVVVLERQNNARTGITTIALFVLTIVRIRCLLKMCVRCSHELLLGLRQELQGFLTTTSSSSSIPSAT